MSTYFVQQCPVCGRPLHISWVYHGGNVVCQHCRGAFVAQHGSRNEEPTDGTADSLGRRTERLLAMCGHQGKPLYVGSQGSDRISFDRAPSHVELQTSF